jgi:transcription antitermination factor NusG
MTDRWYVLRSKPYKEGFLFQQACARGIEVYYPQIRVSPANPRARKIRPYFPSYLFVHIDLAIISASVFQWIPGAAGLVSFGREPAYVPDNLVYAVRRHVDTIAVSGHLPADDFQPGEPVFIQEGLFSGYRAIFDLRVPGRERARVLLELMRDKQQVGLELPIAQISKIKPPKH